MFVIYEHWSLEWFPLKILSRSIVTKSLLVFQGLKSEKSILSLFLEPKNISEKRYTLFNTYKS